MSDENAEFAQRCDPFNPDELTTTGTCAVWRESVAKEFRKTISARDLLIRTAELKRAADICDKWADSVWNVFRDQAMAVRGRAEEILALIFEGGETALVEHDRKLLESLVALAEKWNTECRADDFDSEKHPEFVVDCYLKHADELLRAIEQVKGATK